MLVGLAVGLTGCASLPSSSAPQAVGTIDRQVPATSIEAPVPGRAPDLLLRDFLGASTDPANRHVAARQFLTDDMSESWDDEASTTIVDKVDVLPEARSSNEATYTIRANKVGQLREGGLYEAEEGSYDARIRLEQADGEWRIAALPPGVVMDRALFLGSYQQRSLYFLDPTGTALVPDPRWISGGDDQLAAQLVGLLVEGPKSALEPGVRTELGDGVTLAGPITKADGRTGAVGVGLGGVRINLQGLGGFDTESRTRLAAQLVWTLSNAEISGPYRLEADGAPLDDRQPDGWSTSDVASFDPLAGANPAIGLHALREGSLVKVDDGGLVPLPGVFGTSGGLRSAALSVDGDLVAGVEDTGRPAPEPGMSLLVGDYGTGESAKALDAGSITRPSWDLDGSSAWVAVNGTTVVRVVRERSTGNLSVVGVDTGAITALGSNISELRLSRDGVRAALIVDGDVYLATVVRGSGGGYSLTAPREIGAGLGSPALSLDWSDGETVVVSRAAPETPVVQIAVDGSRTDALPSRNLTSPVVAVDASPTTELVADARAVFQLNNNDPANDRFWREVPGLTGIRAIPVLPG
ncbi:MtrAB system accessory protein LpqB [Rhodococcus rhodnii]|uniref:Lipoprotein LpqB n=1 Tax=Rhodococcus rhodnii TaxID=38312 RepID=A0A6P2CJV3_9NOCA|nr:MtrAB system accessory protein LpqB [Rhodococcus rhodnii]